MLSTKRQSRDSVAFEGGGEGTRTPDPMVANHVLCQLSYTPKPISDFGFYGLNLKHQSKIGNLKSKIMVGLGRFELPTSPLSGVRSNQLSYRPAGLLPQNKGYKFSPVASVWFCSTLPAIELTKNKSAIFQN